MATNAVTRRYERAEFLALSGLLNKELFDTHISDLTPSVPIVGTFVNGNNYTEVYFGGLPIAGDLTALDTKVATFVVVDLTGSTIVRTNAGPVLGPSGTPVPVINYTSPPLQAGKYSVAWTSTHRITAQVANTGSKATVTINGVTQDTHWDRNFVIAYNGNAIFERTAGQTITIGYSISKLGVGAADAEATNVRFTIDKV